MNTTRSRLRTLASAAVVVLATGILAQPAYAASAEDPTVPAPTTGTPRTDRTVSPPLSAGEEALLRRQDTLLPVAQDLAGQARSTRSDIAGVSIDVDASVVDLYRTDPRQPVVLSDGSGTGDVEVRVHPSAFNRTTMAATAGQITRDARALSDERVAVVGVGPAVDGSGVAVSVAGDPADVTALAAARAVLRKRYGAAVGTVTLSARPVDETQLYSGGFRFNDSAPWFGGDRITAGSTSCTSGFFAELAGKPVMLTAGHCGDLNTLWFNGPRSDSSFKQLGKTVFDNDGTDVAAIAVSSASPWINVGSALAPTQASVDTWATPVVGQLLCQSGSFTGEVCGLKVVDVDQSQCKAWFIFCVSWYEPLSDVINAKGPGAFAAGHGDSGGPVYRRHAGGVVVTAEGLVHGQLADAAAGAFPAFVSDKMSCPSPSGPSKRCSAGFSFAQMPGH